MKWIVKKTNLTGNLRIPGSKSHTIRALLIATLAHGTSIIRGALLDGDGASALNAASKLGAKISVIDSVITIEGIGDNLNGGEELIYMGNSGTGTRLFATAAALGSRKRLFDGDHSLHSRPMKPLFDALRNLGASFNTKQNDCDIPFSISGPLTGGKTHVSGISSQFLSSILMSAPLVKDNTVTVIVDDLQEKPYVEITLWWLDKLGIQYNINNTFEIFKIPGNQTYKPINIIHRCCTIISNNYFDTKTTINISNNNVRSIMLYSDIYNEIT